VVCLLQTLLKLMPQVARHGRDDRLGHIESRLERCRLFWLDVKLCDFKDHKQFLKMGRLLRLMAGHTELVAIWIAEVRPVILSVVLGAQPRLALTRAAACQSQGVNLIDLLA
jgi:hypothetical protein